jgi:hypothetical protein
VDGAETNRGGFIRGVRCGKTKTLMAQARVQDSIGVKHPTTWLIQGPLNLNPPFSRRPWPFGTGVECLGHSSSTVPLLFASFPREPSCSGACSLASWATAEMCGPQAQQEHKQCERVSNSSVKYRLCLISCVKHCCCQPRETNRQAAQQYKYVLCARRSPGLLLICRPG